jgi:SMC interacting uncharacterized protein involved in chromosome segregation
MIAGMSSKQVTNAAELTFNFSGSDSGTIHSSATSRKSWTTSERSSNARRLRESTEPRMSATQVSAPVLLITSLWIQRTHSSTPVSQRSGIARRKRKHSEQVTPCIVCTPFQWLMMHSFSSVNYA